MRLLKRSLRNRFFFSLIILVFGASIIIAGVTFFQFKDEAEHYQRDKLDRKVASIQASINYQIENTTYPVETKYIPLIFKDKIFEISHIHDTQIVFFDLEGHLLKSSRATFVREQSEAALQEKILEGLRNSADSHYNFAHEDAAGNKIYSSLSYVTDTHFKPLAILSLPHIESDGFLERELKDFVLILTQVYILLILGAIILSYFFSRYITKSLNAVSKKIYTTRLDQTNQKIKVRSVPWEITGLIKAYNAMIDELEESAIKLATSEREQAWREMARQVAHEVKNPLTPMRLTVQSFERNFDPNDPAIREKVKNYSHSLIEQIDTMSGMASAFSDFAKMPKPKNETLNVSQVVKIALDIFNEDYIRFSSPKKEIFIQFDRTQLIRVITNLVKNAIQATERMEGPEVEVNIEEVGQNVKICIRDNGEGISEEHRSRIFEPKFTTKSSGMGLGLGIIKQIIETYKGNIYFESVVGEGTTFTVEIPKNHKS